MRRHHKTAQLCTQVQRAIEVALASECEDEALQALRVEAVVPAPDESRLAVTLVVPDREAELGREEVLQRLEAVRGALIDEMMNTITRRRCPQLTFVLAREGGEDEAS